jgi:hypothetical protein
MLEAILSSCFHTLYLWTVAHLSPLSISYDDFLILCILPLYLGLLTLFNKAGYHLSKKNYLPLIKFAYNNNHQATIGMPPYEALYGQKCRSPLYWYNIGERQTLGPKLIQDTYDKVRVIKEMMSAAQSR